MNLKDEFKNYVSSNAFKNVNGQIRIIGKLGQISLIKDIYDIWLITPELNPIPERKLTFMLKKFPQNMGVTRLSGEVWAQTKDKNIILGMLGLLKIRKRKSAPLELANNATHHFLNKGA